MLWCSHPLPVLNRGVHGESDRRGHPEQGVPVQSVYPGHSLTPVTFSGDMLQPFPGLVPCSNGYTGMLMQWTHTGIHRIFQAVRHRVSVHIPLTQGFLPSCSSSRRSTSAYPAHAGIPGCHPRLNQCSPCVFPARMASRENGMPGNEQNPRNRSNPGPGSAASLYADASGPGPVSIICPRKSLIPVDETLLNGMWSR